MKTLRLHKKESVKADCVQTSISIRKDQKDFVETENINLSATVREMLDIEMDRVRKKQGGKRGTV